MKHGMKYTSEYSTWGTMKGRCLNPRDSSYYLYGAKGITVCERWLYFSNFLIDMGVKPFKKAQLDRIDNSKGYSKENCRWVNASTNGRNKSNNRLLTFNGETLCIAEWSTITKIKHTTIHQRISYGWSVEDALTKPCRQKGDRTNG